MCSVFCTPRQTAIKKGQPRGMIVCYNHSVQIVRGQSAICFLSKKRTRIKMARRSQKFCGHIGCGEIVTGNIRFCERHKSDEADAIRKRDVRRGSSRARGYTAQWDKYSKWYLLQPEHQLCALRLDGGCAVVAQCVDHIDPPEGPDDPKFWDQNNHQPACIHCNSVKGRRKIIGKIRIDLLP